MKKLVFYTKAGCHLCEVAWQAVEEARRRVPVEVQVVDIQSDPDIYADYRYDVPVVEIDGRTAFRHRVDPAALVERLR